MNVLDKLASVLGRRDEVPNLELAAIIATTRNVSAVDELINGLGQKSAIASDCIKVLYEIGGIDATLIASHAKIFIGLLQHKSNRLQWGAMAALDAITALEPDVVFSSIPSILDAANKGSVITKDRAVNILIQLSAIEKHACQAFALLNEQLLKSPANQLPMYAERAKPVIDGSNREIFVKTLKTRLDDVDKESKRKRIEKVISQVSKKAERSRQA